MTACLKLHVCVNVEIGLVGHVHTRDDEMMQSSFSVRQAWQQLHPGHTSICLESDSEEEPHAASTPVSVSQLESAPGTLTQNSLMLTTQQKSGHRHPDTQSTVLADAPQPHAELKADWSAMSDMSLSPGEMGRGGASETLVTRDLHLPTLPLSRLPRANWSIMDSMDGY